VGLEKRAEPGAARASKVAVMRREPASAVPTLHSAAPPRMLQTHIYVQKLERR